LLLISLWAYAQEDPLKLAILLRAHSGVGIGFWGKLANDLKQPDALGKDFSLRPWATTAGGNLDILIGRRVLLSGGAQLMHFDASETERGLARPYTFHYGGHLGFAAINKNTWLFYPYAGYYVGQAELRYTNYFTEPIHFGLIQELRPLEKETYKTDLGLAEIGLGLRRFKRAQGLTYFWGGDLGVQFSPSKGAWKSPTNNQPLLGVNPVQLTAIYLRFSLGFGYVKSSAPTETPTAIPTAPQKPKKQKEETQVEPQPEKKSQKRTKETEPKSPTPAPEKSKSPDKSQKKSKSEKSKKKSEDSEE
jgi:hypothetical protein